MQENEMAAVFRHNRNQEDLRIFTVPKNLATPARWKQERDTIFTQVEEGYDFLGYFRLQNVEPAPEPMCEKAPDGWSCARRAGHEGPCAAYLKTEN